MAYAGNAPSPMTVSDDIISGQQYYLYNKNSSKYMCVNSLSNGAKLFQNSISPLYGEKYIIQYVTTVNNTLYYNIIPAQATDKRVEIVNASNTDGAEVGLFQVNPPYENAQQFCFISNGDGSYRIQPRLSSNRVIEVQSASTLNQAKIQLYTYVEGQNQQKWIIKRVKMERTKAENANATYKKATAANYAYQHATSPDSSYPGSTSNSANFISQCVNKGGKAMNPTTVTTSTSTTNNNYWFTKNISGTFYTSDTWWRCNNYYTYWGYPGGKIYKETRYYTGWDAMQDYTNIISNYKMGALLQHGNNSTSTHNLEKSMFIYVGDVACDGLHKGTETCINDGSYAEFLYAYQGATNTQSYVSGHGCNLIWDHLTDYFIFMKLNNK